MWNVGLIITLCGAAFTFGLILWMALAYFFIGPGERTKSVLHKAKRLVLVAVAVLVMGLIFMGVGMGAKPVSVSDKELEENALPSLDL